MARLFFSIKNHVFFFFIKYGEKKIHFEGKNLCILKVNSIFLKLFTLLTLNHAYSLKGLVKSK